MLVAFALFHFMDDHAVCFPGYKRLADETGASERTVGDWTRWLVRHGWLRKLEKTRNKTNLVRGVIPTGRQAKSVSHDEGERQIPHPRKADSGESERQLLPTNNPEEPPRLEPPSYLEPPSKTEATKELEPDPADSLDWIDELVPFGEPGGEASFADEGVTVPSRGDSDTAPPPSSSPAALHTSARSTRGQLHGNASDTSSNRIRTTPVSEFLASNPPISDEDHKRMWREYKTKRESEYAKWPLAGDS
jgi:Helix-turn-helix domain